MHSELLMFLVIINGTKLENVTIILIVGENETIFSFTF